MKKAFLFAVLLLVVYGSCAQLAFSYEQVVYGNNLTMPYRKALIAQDNEELSSLVIYLHGGSSRGNDNELQLQEPGTDSIANYLVRKNKKSIFVVPQCPLRKSWVPNMSNAVVAMINSLLSSGLVDPDRVYIFGGSMGGTGTWGMVSANPNMFAAAMPVAGNPSHSNAESVSHTPIYTVMGTADNIMSIPTVQEFLQELEAYGGEYRFDIEEGWTHAQTCIESYTEVRLDWVFSHPADSIYCEITGYGDNNGDWHLIASPLAESIAPTEVGNLVAENAADFDLYRFNQAADLEWENYKTEGFDLEPGKGYLYANKEDVTLIFTGVPYNGTGEVTLSKTTGVNFEGWNLVGNPFNEMAYIVDGRFFYTMNAENTEIIASTSNSIEAMEGIFVIANEDEETMTFTTTEPQNGNGKGLVINLSKGASTPSTGSGTGGSASGNNGGSNSGRPKVNDGASTGSASGHNSSGTSSSSGRTGNGTSTRPRTNSGASTGSASGNNSGRVGNSGNSSRPSGASTGSATGSGRVNSNNSNTRSSGTNGNSSGRVGSSSSNTRSSGNSSSSRSGSSSTRSSSGSSNGRR